MQSWITLTTVIGDLLVLAAAVIDLAAARARPRPGTSCRRRGQGRPAVKR